MGRQHKTSRFVRWAGWMLARAALAALAIPLSHSIFVTWNFGTRLV